MSLLSDIKPRSYFGGNNNGGVLKSTSVFCPSELKTTQTVSACSAACQNIQTADGLRHNMTHSVKHWLAAFYHYIKNTMYKQTVLSKQRAENDSVKVLKSEETFLT